MRLTVRGVTYRVETVGHGPPLLLLHGFTGSRTTWYPFAAKWAAHFRLIMVDLLGHGESDAPADPQRYAVEESAADLSALLDRLAIDSAHVLGYSMGGRLAVSVAALYPDRLRSLVLESSSPGLADPEARRNRKELDDALAEGIEEKGIPAFVQRWETIPLFASQRQLPCEVKERQRAERLRNRPEGLANSLRGMGTGVQPSWWTHLSSFSFPVLLITGEWDEKFCRIAESMAKQLPRAEHRVVPRVGHAVHLEQPDLFGTMVMDFLQGLDVSSANEGGWSQ
ncbi:putative 2-succinyl-6-hydroxy-2,4-cyclohexadiene-1-carboxylate synthase [Marinithermofilum abyssi]|uniref:Putative 2-succinyl-6-hydroxy-2,4-cyclohexadiene-1-carboxylate synthase n=1 Tax=Marinithermofilum abyssi TaxID=1571185 RepID=A0A8J2VHY7_9BACL|nr:2-succinyl-6-hydroxy-2,4-cyclohexadiene-1-carboxylate synthase [Marinithermofilum abyssi]GGE25671.1 putative 2-succinyl-6-hydroxy-2,4-cyclohexadiene-1-carboxylate synthase [Marinithermofilum abyssi]